MKSFVIGVVLLVSTMMTTAAFAKEKKCNFTKWNGSNTEIAISWVGLGFTYNEKKGTASIFYPNRVSEQINFTDLKIIKAPKFTTYIKKIEDITFSYRVYNSGKCSGRSEKKGYLPLTASGRME